MKINTKELAMSTCVSEHMAQVLANLPEEITLVELCNNQDLTIEELWLLHDYYTYHLNEEDTIAFNKRCEISNSVSIFHSKRISDSNVVSESKDVKNSSQISSSERVANSEIVFNSHDVESSQIIASSDYIENSSNIAGSVNITDSKNVCNSSFVFRSTDIFDSKEVNDCQIIFNSEGVSECAFSNKLKNCHHCLFCNEVTDGEYLVFNKPVPQWHFDMIRKRLASFKLSPSLMKFDINIWLESAILTNPTHRFDQYPDSFWEWVKTLPNFNLDIILTITLHAFKI